MSHAEHFLSRLVRLADDEVKLALALYYDSAWVQAILASACVHESAERVALSLSDDAQRGLASELAPESFYLPRAAQQELQQQWEPDQTWMMLDPIVRAAGVRQPARREQPKLGRNALCVCGSGQKHKRCCGARAT